MSEENKIIPAKNPNQQLAIANDLFKDIDFSGLNASIDALAAHNGDLDQDQKKDASIVIDQWQAGVLSRLRKRDQETREFIHFFDVNSETSEEKLESMGFEIADRTGTVELYNAIFEAIDKVNSFRNQKPIKEEIDLDDTIVTTTEKQKAFEKDTALYGVRLRRLENERKIKEVAWKKAIRDTDVVKEILKSARSYSSKIDKFKDECEDKTQLAKLNISIKSKEIREALRDLLNFTIKL